jgi:ribosomal protein S18 acetylase RimI-like enzyme
MGRVGSIVDAARSPSEALRLLDESESALDPSDPLTPWVREGNQRFREQIRDGGLRGALWIGPKDEAAALALWSENPESGRNLAVALGDGFRTPETLARFVRAVEAGAPVRSLCGPIAGLSDADVGKALAPMGFTAVERMDMVFPATAPVPAVPEVEGFPSRPISREDQPRVARLMERAYRDTVDRWLFARTLDDAFGAAAAAEVLGTAVGTWRPDASFGIEVRGSLVAATLVNELDGALLSEVMVDPDWRRRGLARRLIARSIGAVRALGLGPLRLVVTIGNDRAEPLYRSLGFEATPIRGSLWLRVPRTAAGAAEGSSR